MNPSTRLLSIVVPVFNERENLATLVREIVTVMDERHFQYELILVDDGSTDGSSAEFETLCREYPLLKVIELRRNFGQTAAMAAGFHHARGEVCLLYTSDAADE